MKTSNTRPQHEDLEDNLRFPRDDVQDLCWFSIRTSNTEPWWMYWVSHTNEMTMIETQLLTNKENQTYIIDITCIYISCVYIYYSTFDHHFIITHLNGHFKAIIFRKHHTCLMTLKKSGAFIHGHSAVEVNSGAATNLSLRVLNELGSVSTSKRVV